MSYQKTVWQELRSKMGRSRSHKKDLYLHIGVHRTATTSIQATMLRNWKLLKARGILYPFGVAKHIGVFNKIFSGKAKAEKVAEDLLRRADSHGATIHSIVMSDEDVSMRRDLTPLAPFAEFFNVKIVIALRRQDLWLESWWAQNVKGQWDRNLCHTSWPDFMAGRGQFHWIDYNRYLGHLEKVFGSGNVVPYVFEKEQMPRGPIAAFCEQFGFSDVSKLKPGGGANISLSPEVSEFVRYLPFIEAKMGVRLDFIDVAEVVDRGIRKLGGATLLIPHDQRRAIMSEYADGNRAVANRYFSRDRLFFEELPPESAPVTTPSLPGSSEELMNRLVVPFVEELVLRANRRSK